MFQCFKDLGFGSWKWCSEEVLHSNAAKRLFSNDSNSRVHNRLCNAEANNHFIL
jgi:hypothetical protein